MEISIRISDKELGEALAAYLKARGLTYVSHEFVDDNVLQISAGVGVVPAPTVLTAVEPSVVQDGRRPDPAPPARPSKNSNPALSLSELRTYDPDAVEDVDTRDSAADELASVLREMGQLPETPVGVPGRRR